MIEWLIKNGTVVDGTGSPWFRADVAVAGGRIVQVATEIDEPAECVHDADGQVVMPGIIDIPSHTDRTIAEHNRAETAVRQGITTQAVGTCGSSPVPTRQDGEEDSWSSFAELFADLESRGIGINIAPFVGHGAVRGSVMGAEGDGGERVDPSQSEMEKMCELVREARRDGCFGVTTGLQYAPGRNARTAEVSELMRAARPAVHMTHMRDQQSGIREAVGESIQVTRDSGCRTVISHLKMPREQWGWSREILSMLDEAREEGLEVLCDVYPWKYSGVGPLHKKVLPPWVHEDGIDAMVERLENPDIRDRIRHDIEHGVPGWTNSVKVRGWANHTVVFSLREDLHHRTILDIAEEAGSDPLDTACEIIRHDRGQTRACGNTMHEDDIARIMTHPLSMISTDSDALNGLPDEPIHPRGLATYPRLFGHYVREMSVLSLEEAVRKCTSLPASALGLGDRGLIRPGLCADLVVMDPAEVDYPGDFPDPLHFPRGIELTMVSGEAVIRDEEHTGRLPGEVLRA